MKKKKLKILFEDAEKDADYLVGIIKEREAEIEKLKQEIAYFKEHDAMILQLKDDKLFYENLYKSLLGVRDEPILKKV